MTKELSRAFEAAENLPEDAQRLLAEHLIAEIDGELHWEKTLAENPNELERLADKALKEFRAGKTQQKGFGEG